MRVGLGVALFCMVFGGTLPARSGAQDHASVDATKRSASKVAEGVYVIRHPDAPSGFPQGNTTVVVGSRSVLVVDSDYLPSTAREDIAQIKQWTNKPVKYLVNTHWHYDHTFGNGAYAAAFPGLEIIAHAETAVQMTGWNASWFKDYPARIATSKQQLASGVNAGGAALSEQDRARLQRSLDARERVWKEFAGYQVTLPTLLFDRDFSIDLGDRIVWIKYLGRGNTTGDAVVYVPDAKVVATGDLLAHPVPYLAGGHPGELVRTLRSIGRLDATVVVPGHGAVQHDMTFLNSVADFVELVVTHVDNEFYRLGTSWDNVSKMRESVEAAIDIPAWRQRFTGGHPENVAFFDGYSFPELVKAAFAVAWGR